jgi:signal peptidase I
MGFFRRRKLIRESKALVRETRRILRKRGWRIPPDKAREIGQRADMLRDAVRARDFDAMPRELAALDEQVDKHLAFARKSTLREYAESVGTAVLIALLLRSFVVEAFKIPSGSMIPTLEIGDHIFVNKFIYDFRKPHRGDVIVFKYPPDPSQDYIKRVVGVEGDRVEVRDGRVWVNGTSYGEANCPPGSRWGCDGPTIVPQDHLFVMGDNRDDSSDSRFWGFVPAKLIKGEAMFVWYSPHLARIGHVIH